MASGQQFFTFGADFIANGTIDILAKCYKISVELELDADMCVLRVQPLLFPFYFSRTSPPVYAAAVSSADQDLYF